MNSLAAVADSMRRQIADTRLRVRWVAPENYHVTLRFLGSTQPETVAAIRDALREPLAALPSFSFSGSGLGAFPRAERARVIWAGVDDPEDILSQIAATIDRELDELGFAREYRSFHPHVTLGRIKHPSDVAELLAVDSEQMFRKIRVDAVILFESLLKSTGSEYIPRARFALQGGAAQPERHTERLKPGPDLGQGEPAAETGEDVVCQPTKPASEVATLDTGNES